MAVVPYWQKNPALSEERAETVVCAAAYVGHTEQGELEGAHRGERSADGRGSGIMWA